MATFRMEKHFIAVALLLFSSIAAGQSRPEDGGREIDVWTGGGHSVPGGTSKTSVWNIGARYGWILTRPHGPGFLKGRFEYAVDIVPLFIAFQGANRFEAANTAYGAGFDPLNLKWNFATRGKIVPYFELSGGVLFTNRDVPAGTNDINFTPGAALGTHFLTEKYNWSMEVRYQHISNSGLAVPNPGLNTVQVHVGIGKFFKR